MRGINEKKLLYEIRCMRDFLNQTGIFYWQSFPTVHWRKYPRALFQNRLLKRQKTFSYRTMMVDCLKLGAKWCSAPKPMLLDSLFEVDLDKPTPRNGEPAFDAANVMLLLDQRRDKFSV